MKRVNDKAVMKYDSYISPQTWILDLYPEGVLCASPGDYSSADDFIVGPALDKDDYEQIY